MGEDGTDTELGGLLRGLARAPAVEPPPRQIGRFAVTGTLGAGGMGVVYQAEDPTLGRAVAIKLLRAGRDGTAAAASASRLLREAQALARLSHPNVVTIYEAGTDGDRVYLAMELITGTTARAWCAAAPRTLGDVLGVYRQAAAGLAAAHAAGMVHRDIKPENLLVGNDGRVRVTDFGLVAALELGPSGGGPGDEPVDPMAVTMTRTGAVMGTPPYMPPEAHLARPVDARGDQWSLAASIWEAIGGARPYAGATYPELVANICAGRRVAPPVPIPEPIRGVLERGLAIDPAQRWPSVSAMMAALEPRRGRGLALALGLGVAAAAVVGGWWVTREPGTTPRIDAAPRVVVAPAPASDAAPPPAGVKLYAGTGDYVVPCKGDLCGDGELRADKATLSLRIEAPPGVIVRLPGGEGRHGDVVSLDLRTLLRTLPLPVDQGSGLYRAPLAMWVEIATAPDQPGEAHTITLQLDRVVDELLGEISSEPLRWPDEDAPVYRADVLAHLKLAQAGSPIYLETLGPPGATMWELDRIVLEHDVYGHCPPALSRMTDLELWVIDRRTRRTEIDKVFEVDPAKCDDPAATYDRKAVDQWLQTLIEPRPAGADEPPPPPIPLGGAASAAANVDFGVDPEVLAAEDAISARIAADQAWPVEPSGTSPLAKRLDALGCEPSESRQLPYGLDLVTCTLDGQRVQALELVVPKPGAHETVAGLVTPMWAAVVVGRHLFDPGAAQALFDVISNNVYYPDKLNAAATALGWREVEHDGLHHLVPIYVSQPWLANARGKPIGRAAVIAIQYNDLIFDADPRVVTDITANHVLVIRAEGGNADAQTLLTGVLKAQRRRQ